MKFIFIPLILFSPMAQAAGCPTQVLITLECAPNKNNFQLLKHVGKYTQPKLELNASQNMVICSYRSNEWISQYRYLDKSNQIHLANVTNLEGLSKIAEIIDEHGFEVDHFSENSSPFSMLTFKEQGDRFLVDEIFLFSGLESTFENKGFNVKAYDKKLVSTVVINERYLKSKNVAADTFETGSNCSIQIK